MAQFRKKPVVIEAVRFAGLVSGVCTFDGGSFGSLGKIPDWLTEALDRPSYEPGAMAPAEDGYVAAINTLEGRHIAQPGDWIICGVHGELYPCKPDIFAMTYEPA